MSDTLIKNTELCIKRADFLKGSVVISTFDTERMSVTCWMSFHTFMNYTGMNKMWRGHLEHMHQQADSRPVAELLSEAERNVGKPQQVTLDVDELIAHVKGAETCELPIITYLMVVNNEIASHGGNQLIANVEESSLRELQLAVRDLFQQSMLA